MMQTDTQTNPAIRDIVVLLARAQVRALAAAEPANDDRAPSKEVRP